MNSIINQNRFDLMAKLLYIKNFEKNIHSIFYEKLYKEHINTFNKNWEYPGTKVKIEDFIESFNNLITSIKKRGFDKNFPIEVGNLNNTLKNGAHRLMISYYFNLKPDIKNYKLNCSTYNYDFFLNRNNYWRRDNEIYSNLSVKYADRMALEYVKIKKNIRCMILYPTSFKFGKEKNIQNIIDKYGNIYYKKQIKLSKNGVINLIKELYRGESWVGGMFPGDHCGGKFKLCYEDKPVIMYLIEFNNCNKIIEFKEKCRELFKIGKHSLHISDEINDTFRIASSLLNDNSIHFLNNANNNIISDKIRKYLIEFFNNYSVNKDSNNMCLTSSLIMELYGLRNAKDIDYIHINDSKIKIKMFGCHDDNWIKYYKIPKNEIIYNPENYFYFNGFKFVSLNILKRMKQNRNEEKDRNDLKLINKLI